MTRAYAFITDQVQIYSWYRDQLTSPAARNKFDRLNHGYHHNDPVFPGQVLIYGDDSSSQCTYEEDQMSWQARDVRSAFIGSSFTVQRGLMENFDVLQDILTYGSIGVGSVTGAWKNHLKQVETTLNEINSAYQSWRSDALNKDQFIARRKALFAALDDQLRGIGRWGTGLKKNSTIKKMFGYSSKRFLHTGELRAYAQQVKRIGSMARALSNGTFVGVALDIGAGALEIEEACSTGREEQCTKAKFVEVGKMVAGIPSAMVGGRVGLKASASLCFKLVGPSRGGSLLACGIAGGAIGAWAAGKGGSAAGEYVSTLLYELTGND
jgi:hypothetical protein